PPGGIPPVSIFYRNDDGGPGFAKDARVTFEAPADGDYLVRVEDARGFGGGGYGYHLVVRRPRPDFRLTLGADNPHIPRGSTPLVSATIPRLDRSDGPVEVRVEGLPPGITATSATIEPGAFSAEIGLTADASAPATSPPTWRVSARSGEIRHDLDPGGPSSGF